MKTVLRLVYLYFMATPITRALTIGGIVSCLISLYVVTYLPQPVHMTAFAWPGQIAFFLGSSLMPLMVGRLAQGHVGGVLPYARWKLLLSMLLTVFIVVLPAGILTPFALVAGTGGSTSTLTENPRLLHYVLGDAALIYTSFVIVAGWLYVVTWFVSRERNVMGFAKGMLVVVFLLNVPTREIRELSATIRWNLEQLAVAWTVFGALFLAWPRIRNARSLRGRGATSSGSGFSRSTSGRELDLILGTSNPWLFVAAQLAPIALAAWVGVRLPSIWLYFLATFSTVSGAIAGQAAERSRPLWLRSGLSRRELFGAVEKSVLRYNSIVLALLLVLLTAIAVNAGLPFDLMAVGLPLMTIGTLASTYLGLSLTRGLRWAESTLAVVVMLSIMSVPLMMEAPGKYRPVIIGVEAGLALLTFILRNVAARRWAAIDWTQCRPLRSIALRGV